MKFLLLDDHKIFSRSFSLLLREAGFDDVVICELPESVQEYIDSEESIMVFMDYLIPQLDTPQLIKQWKTHVNVLLVVISGITNPYQIAGVLRSNADAFISKSAEPDEVHRCIKEVLQGKTYISNEFRDEVTKVLINHGTLFTPREIEIIRLIKEGKSIKEKAQILFLSENTVVVHRRNIMQKAGVKSITELMIKIDELLY